MIYSAQVEVVALEAWALPAANAAAGASAWGEARRGSTESRVRGHIRQYRADVIGCVYLYPSPSDDWDVMVKSWVRADRSELDGPLADAVARWLAADWPWERVDRCGR